MTQSSKESNNNLSTISIKDFSITYSNPKLINRLNELEYSIKIINEKRLFNELVNTSKSKMQPFHRWAKYREAFSGALVKELIHRSNLAASKVFVFDPMCGSGATLVASAQLGFDSLGLDVLPYSVDLTNAKVAQYTPKAIRAIQDFVNSTFLDKLPINGQSFNSLTESKNYFKQRNLEKLERIHGAIKIVSDQLARKFLFVAWLSILEDCSNRTKAGNGLATRTSEVENVWSHFVSRVEMFLEDICRYRLPKVISRAYNDSALKSSELVEKFVEQTKKELGVVIFSPPYANSFDYFESYKLELLAGYYNKNALIEARKGAIRNYRKGYGYHLRTNDELVGLLCEEVSTRIPKKESRTGRIDSRSRLVPNLLTGYFQDMEKVVQELGSCMNANSFCYIVVNQSSYLGVIIPTDLILANTAMKNGFDVSHLIYCGKANTSAQQLKEYKYLRTHLRKSIIVLRKK